MKSWCRVPIGRLALAVLTAGSALWVAARAPGGDDPPTAAGSDVPAIRRVFVPEKRLDVVLPAGDWVPIPISELDRQLAAARAAQRARPAAFIEKAEYSATLVDDELKEARLEWQVRRPDSRLSLLSVGRLNLNVSGLGWSPRLTGQSPAAAVWGAGPTGASAIVLNRPAGRLVADWSLPGRRLAASTEFDVELAPAAISQMLLRVPTGLVLTSTAGELSGPAATADSGWNEWRLNLGSQSSCRLRMAPPQEPQAARPLILVRSNLNYDVRSEAVRVLAEFTMNVLEAGVQELRIVVDPEVQVTAVEYGDDGAVAWQSVPASAGQAIVVRLPDTVVGEGHTLQVQGIAQVKQFAAWTLPRIRLQNSVESAGRATLRLQSPFLAADVKTDGYRQLELTASADDGEVLVFRRFREDGTITVVPNDSKADLTCRAVTLLQPDRHQWSLVSEWDWKAATGSSFTASLLVSGLWEIVDVRLPSGGRAGELSTWKVDETDPGRRMLHLYFVNALKPERPQRVRISARRLPPASGAPAVVPPLVPVDVNDIEQLFVVATGADWRPVVTAASGFEPVDIRDFPDETRGLDFLGPRLTDRQTRAVAFRALGTAAQSELHIERIERLRDAESDSTSPVEEQPDEEQPRAAASESPTSNIAERTASPVSLAVTARVAGLSSGFDHYVGEFRLPRLAEGTSFRWSLPRPAEVIGATLDARRVVPGVDGANYSITAPLSAPTDAPAQADVSTLAIEYRNPSAMHLGPNWRSLALPLAERPVLHFSLALILPDGIRLEGQPHGLGLEGFAGESSWWRHLLGPFSRAADQPIFNPFGRESWAALLNEDNRSHDDMSADHAWRGAAAYPPDDLQIVIWNSTEVTWWSWLVLLLSLLAGSLARLAQKVWRHSVGTAALAVLALLALVLPGVLAELAASALTGLILVILLPQQFFVLAPHTVRRDFATVPMGSTQSFVPIAGLMLAAVGAGMALVAEAQDEQSTPSAASRSDSRTGQRPVVDILVPVGVDGEPVGKSPVVYVPANFLPRLKQMSQPFEMPAYLIAECSYHGIIDESNRLLVSARFEVHVLAGEPRVPVHLPLGLVNLGGSDACLVNGRPTPVAAGPEGRGLVVEVPGAEPLPSTPAEPEPEASVDSDRDAASALESDRAIEPFPIEKYTIELQLYPAVETGRGGVCSGTLSVPPGCQSRAILSSPRALSLLGISPTAATPPGWRPNLQPTDFVAVRPGPASQFVFYWSPMEMRKGDEPLSRAPAEVQVGVSCLADVSPALIQMRYHLAYRVQTGQMDSLTWYVPAGYALESVQAPQLAGYRFDPAADGSRRMLIEFSRPQTGDFSLAATFAMAVDRYAKQIPLPLLDPLRAEEGGKSQLSLRFHQFAVRQPSDFLASVSAAAGEHPLKPRPVDEFLKEWNAAGARPQQVFDLERVFALNLSLEQQPAIPAVRGSSIGRFHPGHLDWTYTAEVAQTAVPQFLYRLHVDPRLRIRSVSVQEDGAERLLRPAQMRETLVLFLNDRATRAQTVRIDATLPMAVSQVIELPRIRFAGATPATERVTLYRDADISVKLANPEDFPPLEGGGSGPDPRGDRLVGRVDVLPEQSSLRVAVEPVLPVVSAEVATVLESRSERWQFTTGVEFQVGSGRVNEFTLELPEALAARVETRSVPESHVAMHPAVDGRVTLAFHPDEPGLGRFVAILTGPVDMSSSTWQIPPIVVPGAGQTETLLFTPRRMIEPAFHTNEADPVVVPDWLKEAVPESNNAALWNSYRWSGEPPAGEFHPTREGFSKTLVGSARIELWMQRDGSIQGWLGISLVGNPGPKIELNWPETARPTGLFANGAFQPLPVPGEGRCSLALPPATTGRFVWLSWSDTQKSLPFISGELPARIPWLYAIPVEKCQVVVHAPRNYQLQALAPLAPAANTAQNDLVPSVFDRPDTDEKSRAGEVALALVPVPGPGHPLELGSLARVANQSPIQFGVALAAALLLALAAWKTAPFWRWLAQHEMLSWLVLAAFWWLCLEPSWLGPLIAVWAGFRATRRRHPAGFESPSAADVQSFG